MPEIEDDATHTISPSPPSSTITSLIYHKLKARLYRVMGPFLGRKKQTTQLQRLLEVHHGLTDWYAGVPGLLKCSGDSPEFDTRPILTQMQAIALQLAYDNLRMVLFRQAVFPKDSRENHQPHREESIRQLSESATRTAKISTFAATGLICRSSHAAMHVGICSFTAGVILCTLLTHQPDDQEQTE